MRHSLKVVRVYAAPNAAEVIHLKPSRYLATDKSKGRAVGHFTSAEAAITLRIDGAEPEPAA